MPEQVSRFFLFDGELLQQYEELLRNDSEMGRQIKESVERILGVPVLTNARTDLADLGRTQNGKNLPQLKRTKERGSLDS